MMNPDFLGIFWGSSLASAALGSAGLGVLILLCCSPVDPPACLGQWEIPGGGFGSLISKLVLSGRVARWPRGGGLSRPGESLLQRGSGGGLHPIVAGWGW